MINKLLKKLFSRARGFTLVETLIAVIILVTAVSGPLSIAARGLTTALIAKDQVTAYYLAQDGMEFVRFVRDTNKLQSGDWLTGAGDLDASKRIDLSNCAGANGCSVDSAAGTTPTSCSSATCSQGNMRYDTVTRLYKTAGTLTGLTFNRVIKITTPNPPSTNTTERTITVTVSWSDAAGVTGSGCSANFRCVIIQENIFDWE